MNFKKCKYIQISTNPDEHIHSRTYISFSKYAFFPVLKLQKLYVSKFYHYGYEDTRLISGMKESELEEIGIKLKGHRQRLLQRIKLLPDFEPNTEVPVSHFAILITHLITTWTIDLFGCNFLLKYFHSNSAVSQ